MSSVAVFSEAVLPSFPEETLESAFAARRTRAMGALPSSVRVASALEVRPAPAMMPFGIASLDALTGGVPRGALTELFGPASSGRTSVMLSLVGAVTRRQEVCAVIDVTDSFDPVSAEAAGVDLKRLLWVRCGKSGECTLDSGPRPAVQNTRAKAATMNEVAPPAKNISWSIHQNYDARLRHAITGGCYEMARGRELRAKPAANPNKVARIRNLTHEIQKLRSGTRAPASKWTKLDQALKATDLLLQSGGFGLIVIDLGDISIEQARRIPLTSWFRFRRVVENTPTILLLVARDSCAKTCASLVLQLRASGEWTVNGGRQEPSSCPPCHIHLLDGLNVQVELVRTRLERKPARSTGSLITQTLWKRSG